VAEAVVYELSEPELEHQVIKGVYQAFAQVSRRHDRVALEDDEFFQNDKIRRIDQARKTYRSGTRPPFRGSVPEREGPISQLLRPTPPDTAPLVFDLVTDKTHQFASAASASAAPGAALPFPGSIPVSLMQADIKRLYDASAFYVWSWKANGLRVLMVAGTYRGQQLIMLYDRARRIYVVPMAAPALVFDGTILDGELVRQHDGRYAYVVYDAIMTAGVSCGEYNYLVRLQNASFLLESGGWADLARSGGPFALTVKPVYSPTQIADVLETVLPSLNYGIDGFIATPVEPPVKMGQADNIFKYKRGTDHTIDFKSVVQTPTTLVTPSTVEVDLLAARNLGSGAGGVRSSGGSLWAHWATIKLRIEDPETEALAKRLGANDMSSLLQLIDNKIVDCRYDPPTETWQIEIIRFDKTAPNKLSTAWKTWQNIRENLTILDLFPERWIPAETRERIRLWEFANPRWPIPIPSLSSSSSSSLPPPMAPVPLQRAAQFR
jgi:hypothetical protein